MSKIKANRVRELAQIPPGLKRWEKLHFATPLHAEAFSFLHFVHSALWFKTNPHANTGIPFKEIQKWTERTKTRYAEAIEQFSLRFLDSYRRKDGKFFRALADVIEGPNPNWTELERFVLAQCQNAEACGTPLPTAGQFLRAWKIRNRNLPEGEDLKTVWRVMFPGRTIPQNEDRIKSVLRPYYGLESVGLTIMQIQRAAKNVGYTLPKHQRGKRGLPAGLCDMADLPPEIQAALKTLPSFKGRTHMRK